MKLLLTSAGLSNDSIAKSFLDLVGLPASEIKIVYIPTAANVEEGDKGWLIKDLANLKDKTFEVDIVDISALPKNMWLSRLEAANVFLFGGGNSFYLLHWIRKSGLDKLLPELLKTRVYVGISAGSMVPCPNLVLSTSSKNIYDEANLGITDDSGLNFVNFCVRPHLNSPFFPKAKEEFIRESAKNISEPIYALDDNSAISVDGDKVVVISEGNYLQLNRK